MSNESKTRNPHTTASYGKRHDELPLLPSPPIPVVRNKESMYYGMTLKKAQRLHRKLYPHPPPPPEPEGCFMYRVKYRKVKDGERITDPVEWTKGTVENLAKWLCKTGLLKPGSKREQQHPRRPYKHVAIGERWYSVRLPCKPGERFMVNELVDLGVRVQLFAMHYANNQLAKAVWEAFEIGAMAARVEAAQYDAAVKYGHPGLAELTKHRENANAQRRKQRQPLWDAIIKMNQDKRRRGISPNARYEQIERELKAQGGSGLL